MELSENEGGAKRTRKPTEAAAKPKVLVKAKKVKLPASAATADLLEASPEAPSPAELDFKIAETAYHLAARRGFEPGHELDDWLEAERLVTRRL